MTFSPTAVALYVSGGGRRRLPRVDERLVGRRHRYGYTVGFEPNPSGDVDFTRAILKHDLTSGRSQVRSFGALSGAGEFVFVPERLDAAEDEGVLMGYVYDGETDRSDLIVLNGRTLETVTEVHLPVRVPYGFHGNWIPAA